jgi:tetratricopeptide (TPR) repeat protein
MQRSLIDLEKAVTNGANPLAYLPLAEELRKRRQFDRALEVCRHGLRRGGPSVRGYTILGKIQFDRSNLSDAIDSFRRAYDLAPGSYEPTLLLAKVLAMRSEFFEARECINALSSSYPNDPEVKQLHRIIQRELHAATGENPMFAEGMPAEVSTPSLVAELEETPGVRAVFVFGLRTVKGDVFFDEVEAHEIDDKAKVAIMESFHLTSKLGFGNPRLITFESPAGRLILRVEDESALLAVTTEDVMLGKVRFLMDQILRTRRRG